MPQYSTKVEITNQQIVVFLQEWARALKVSVPVLLSRILAAAVTGEHYVTKMPRDVNSP
jgi:hypothetical protein